MSEFQANNEMSVKPKSNDDLSRMYNERKPIKGVEAFAKNEKPKKKGDVNDSSTWALV